MFYFYVQFRVYKSDNVFHQVKFQARDPVNAAHIAARMFRNKAEYYVSMSPQREIVMAEFVN